MLVNWSGGTMSVAVSNPSVTLLSADSAKRLRTKYSAATLIQMSQNVWLLTGDITI
jgi:beta-lactamase superfamily II metal-dependent hydrolase